MLPSEWGQQSVRHDDDHKFKDEPGVPFTQCSLEIHPDDNAGTFAALQGSHSWSLTTLAFTSAGRKSRKVFVSNSSQNFSLPQGKEIRANASSTPSSSPSSSRVYESHHLDSCRYGENKGISSPLTGGLNNNMKKTRGRKMHINNMTSVKDHTQTKMKSILCINVFFLHLNVLFPPIDVLWGLLTIFSVTKDSPCVFCIICVVDTRLDSRGNKDEKGKQRWD